MDDAETMRFDGQDPVDAAADQLARRMSGEVSLSKCRDIFRFYTANMAKMVRLKVAEALKTKHGINLSVRKRRKDESGHLFSPDRTVGREQDESNQSLP